MTRGLAMARRVTGRRSERDLLAVLTRAAAVGDAAPSNDALAVACGFKSDAAPVNVLRRLERMGLVVTERGPCGRRFTIVATGARTAWGRAVGERVDFSRETADESAAAAQRVDRDPCPRCGVRRDIGCGHSGRALSVRP